MKQYKHILGGFVLSLGLCLPSWGSAQEKESIFPEITLASSAAHAARFPEGERLHNYLDGMCTFCKQKAYPLPVTRAVYQLLLKGCVDSPQAWTGYAKKVIARIEERFPESFSNARNALEKLEPDFVARYVVGQEKILKALYTESPVNFKEIATVCAARDIGSLLHLFSKEENPLNLSRLLMVGFFEQVYFLQKQPNLEDVRLRASLEEILAYPMDWQKVLPLMYTPAPPLLDPSAPLAVLAQSYQNLGEYVALTQEVLSLITPMILLHTPLTRLYERGYVHRPADYPLPAASGFLAAMEVLAQTKDVSMFGKKMTLMESVYPGNSLASCVEEWQLDETGTSVKAVLPIFTKFHQLNQLESAREQGPTEYFLTLKYYLSWWSDYFYEQAMGPSPVFKSAFALAYTAWRETGSLYLQEDLLEHFSLTPEEQQGLIEFKLLPDRGAPIS